MAPKYLLPAVICLLASALLQCGSSRQKQASRPLPAETEPVVIVREPARTARDEPVGLLVALHGNNQTEDQFAELWRDGFFYEPNFILASVRAPFKGNRGYIWYARSTGRQDLNSDDRWLPAMRTTEARVMAVYDSLSGCYNLDPNRIHIVGASLGAGVAAFIYLRHTDAFTGLAMLAGCMNRTSGTMPAEGELADVPVFISMGEAEGPGPREGARRNRSELARAGADVRLFVHPEGHVITQPIIRAMQNHLGLSYSFAPEVHKIETSPGRLEDEGSEGTAPGPDDEFAPTDE
jgi:predicted esterase